MTDEEQLCTQLHKFGEQVIASYAEAWQRACERNDREHMADIDRRRRDDLAQVYRPLIELAHLTPPKPMVIPKTFLKGE